jgi:hypothetical protein
MKRSRDSQSLSFRSVAMIATAMGAVAVGSFAVGALAVGALAIGRLAIGRIDTGGAKLKSLEIEDLVGKRLRVGEAVLDLPYACRRVPIAGSSPRLRIATRTGSILATYGSILATYGPLRQCRGGKEGRRE